MSPAELVWHAMLHGRAQAGDVVVLCDLEDAGRPLTVLDQRGDGAVIGRHGLDSRRARAEAARLMGSSPTPSDILVEAYLGRVRDTHEVG